MAHAWRPLSDPGWKILRHAKSASENRYSPCRCHAAPPRHTAGPQLSRPGRSGRPRGPIACELSVAPIGPRSKLPHRQGGVPADESVDDPVYPIFPNAVACILASYLFPLFFFPGIEMPSQSASPQEPFSLQDLAEPRGSAPLAPPVPLLRFPAATPLYNIGGKTGEFPPRPPTRAHPNNYRPVPNQPSNRRKKDPLNRHLPIAPYPENPLPSRKSRSKKPLTNPPKSSTIVLAPRTFLRVGVSFPGDNLSIRHSLRPISRTTDGTPTPGETDHG